MKIIQSLAVLALIATSTEAIRILADPAPAPAAPKPEGTGVNAPLRSAAVGAVAGATAKP